MKYILALIPVVLIAVLAACGYVKAPPDTAYIISGFRKPRILIGKAGIRIPFLERLDKLCRLCLDFNWEFRFICVKIYDLILNSK